MQYLTRRAIYAATELLDEVLLLTYSRPRALYDDVKHRG